MLLGKTKRTALIAITLTAFTAAPLGAYDGLPEDMSTCMAGSGKATNEQIVAACTRLIDNARKENELIGFAYAMRAASNTNKASNCRDARKAIKLVKTPKVVEGVNQIIKANC